ncbi:MAG: porin family protein, partial [Devosia sp.]
MRFTKTLMLAAAVVAAPAAAQAADLYVPAPPVVAAPMVSGLWEGPYVGVHVGYITAEADHIL